MKKVMPFFVLLTTLFLGCKKEATPTQNDLADKTNAKATEKTPYVSSINSRYVLIDSSAIQVFIAITTENIDVSEKAVENFCTTFRLNWNLASDYGIKERIKAGRLELKPENVQFKNGQFYLSFQVPRTNLFEKGLLLAELIDSKASKKFTTDIPIDFTGKRFGSRFGLYKKTLKYPIFESYVALNDTLIVEAIKPTNREFYLMAFEANFGAARSPMSTKPSFENLHLASTHIQKVATGQLIVFEKEGLYVLTEDTADVQKGTAICVVDDRFPRFTYPNELTQPLVYMSTNTETDAVKQNTDAKQALDMFFLQLAQGNHSLAKQIIRSYFRRVTDANRLFTNYKEGWKTDRGMVYIIMGPPSRIQRLREREVWLYAQTENTSEVIFTFFRKPNQFTDDNYELVRYPDYSQYWYPYVEAWRNGKIIE